MLVVLVILVYIEFALIRYIAFAANLTLIQVIPQLSTNQKVDITIFAEYAIKPIILILFFVLFVIFQVLAGDRGVI